MSQNHLPQDQMRCPECGGIAESDSVDIGVGLYVRGNFACSCGWELDAEGKMRVDSYADYFPDQTTPLEFAFAEF